MIIEFLNRNVWQKYLNGNSRNSQLNRNILLTLVYQIFTNVLSLVAIPIILTYLDNERYGIWVNASVMVAWLQNMNLGLGAGLQNKVAEAQSVQQLSLAKSYVTIVYHLTTLISIILAIIFIPLIYYTNWNNVFNTTIPNSELRDVVLISFFTFLMFFVLGNINYILAAFRRNAQTKLYGFLSSLLTIVLFFSILQFSKNNLILAALALALPTPLIYLGSNIYEFSRNFKNIRPSFKIRDLSLVKPLFVLGSKFFVTQICAIVIFQTGAIIITQLYGPAEVTPYNVIGRYFYFGQFIFNTVIGIYTSAYTEAYIKKDFDWIHNTITRQYRLGALAGLIVILMYIGAFWLIPIWSRGQVSISENQLLTISFVPYTILSFYIAIVSTFLNGISALRLQVALYIGAAILNIPLALLLAKVFMLGAASVVFATSILLLFILIFSQRQVRKTLSQAKR